MTNSGDLDQLASSKEQTFYGGTFTNGHLSTSPQQPPHYYSYFSNIPTCKFCYKFNPSPYNSQFLFLLVPTHGCLGRLYYIYIFFYLFLFFSNFLFAFLHTNIDPSEKVSTLKGKNLLPKGANSFLLEYPPFQKGYITSDRSKAVFL